MGSKNPNRLFRRHIDRLQEFSWSQSPRLRAQLGSKPGSVNDMEVQNLGPDVVGHLFTFSFPVEKQTTCCKGHVHDTLQCVVIEFGSELPAATRNGLLQGGFLSIYFHKRFDRNAVRRCLVKFLSHHFKVKNLRLLGFACLRQTFVLGGCFCSIGRQHNFGDDIDVDEFTL